MLKSAACLWHICFKVRSLCGFPYRFCNGFKLNSSCHLNSLRWSAESCFVWKWLLLRCASNIINFTASFMTMDLFGQCDCASVAWFLSFSIGIWGIGWVWSSVCLLQLWTAWSEPVVEHHISADESPALCSQEGQGCRCWWCWYGWC